MTNLMRFRETMDWCAQNRRDLLATAIEDYQYVKAVYRREARKRLRRMRTA